MGMLDDRRALVTGGGRGIGAAIARRLAAEGADVVVLDRDPADDLAREIGARALQADVSDVGQVQAAIGAESGFDVLVNNAGFDDPGWFTDTTPARWHRLLEVNVVGVLACTQAVLPAMQQAGYGRILAVGSEAGRIGASGNAVYAATKGALASFMKSIARENARFAITANTLVSGPVDTPLLDTVRAQGALGEEMVAAMERGTLLGRLGRPEETAAVAASLVSEQASYVTGQDVGVSGGMGV